jgi:arylformamidase
MTDTVFLHYDRAALDAEYDNRAKVADALAHLERFAARSARTRERPGCRLDLAFGEAPGERLDVFPAPGGGPAPIQLFVHGGYWKGLDKNDFSYVADGFGPAGVTTVVVNYDLVPGVSMDTLVQQVRAAVAWTWTHAESIGGDRDRLFVSGHSAGGHLVAMLMATDWSRFAVGLPPDPIRGGFGLSGLYDLEPIRLCFLNDELHLDEAEAARNSPVRLNRHVEAPLVLPVGALEGPEYLRQSQDLAAAWRTGPSDPEVMVVDGRDHFSIVADLGEPESDLARAVWRQMGLL